MEIIILMFLEIQLVLSEALFDIIFQVLSMDSVYNNGIDKSNRS